MTRQRIAVGLSGGVDSSLTAAMLVAQGHDVIGISLQLAAEPADPAQRTCCSALELQRAQRLCDELAIPYYRFDLRAAFERQIVAPFVAAYLSGTTPNPCVLCNKYFKFGAMLQRARLLGAELATGHYVKIIEHRGQRLLARATDGHKDQSYFLALIDPTALDHLIFPLGAHTKPEVRALAQARGLSSFDRPDSQEVCFVPASTSDFIASRAALPPPGDIVDGQGAVLGHHRGIHRYTIGQRRGLGVGGGSRLYVTAIAAESNSVQVGTADQLRVERVRVGQVNGFVAAAELVRGEVQVKLRARMEPAAATVRWLSEDQLEVQFVQPEKRGAPGQAAAIYRDNVLLAGGIID